MSFLEEGHLVGRYRVEAFLAEGGMGRVYRAVDTLLGRRVALKVLARGHAPDSPAVARLVREARAAAALSHPNICSVFDIGELDGLPFIAMELVEGTSLRALLTSPGIGLGQRLRWIHDLATALAAAHRAHLVHRDIKPENVMVAGDGRVRLLDFGIATWAGGGALEAVSAGPGVAGEFRTRDGEIVGTVGYMAPEQSWGQPVDVRSDQFAWGVLAYETLSGRHPFGTGSAFDEFPPLGSLIPELPPGVAAIVARTLAIDPVQRFAAMDEIVALLQPIVGALPALPALPAPATGGPLADLLAAGLADPTVRDRASSRAKPPRRGARGLRIGAALIGGAAIAAAAAIRVARDPAPGAAVAAPGFELGVSHVRRVTFGDGCDEFPAFTPDGRALIYDGDDSDGHTVLYWASLGEGATPRVLVHQDDPGRDTVASVSPAGGRIVFRHAGVDQRAAMLANLDGTGARAVGDVANFPRWSPDGGAIWTRRQGVYGLYDAASGAALRTVAVPPGVSAIWMLGRADGPVVAQVVSATGATPTGLWLFGADGRLRWQHHDQFEPALALTPDGNHALASRQSASGTAELVAVPFDGSPIVSLAATGVAARDGLDISADGKQLAWSTCRGAPRVSAIDAAGHAAPTLASEAEDIQAVARIPGSADLLVVSSRTGPPRLWRMDPGGARPPRPVATGDRDVHDIAVSPDGTRFAVSVPGAGIAVGALRGDAGLRVITDNPGDASPCFRKAGDALAFTRPRADGTGQVMVVPFGGGAPTALLAPGTRGAAISPADDAIAYLAGDRGVPWIADPRGEHARPLAPALPPASYHDLRFSPDGSRALVRRGNEDLVELDVARGEILRTVTAARRELFYSPSYGPGDGAEIVAIAVRWQGNLYVADAEFRSPARGPR